MTNFSITPNNITFPGLPLETTAVWPLLSGESKDNWAKFWKNQGITT